MIKKWFALESGSGRSYWARYSVSAQKPPENIEPMDSGWRAGTGDGIQRGESSLTEGPLKTGWRGNFDGKVA